MKFYFKNNRENQFSEYYNNLIAQGIHTKENEVILKFNYFLINYFLILILLI